jgi:hypothetical protein
MRRVIAAILMMPGIAFAQPAGQPIPLGIYERADEIRPGERGFVCLCKGEFTATPGAIKTETGEEKPVIVVQGRQFWPTRHAPEKMLHIPQE